MQRFRSTRAAFLLTVALGLTATGAAGTTWYVDDDVDICSDISGGGEEDSPFCSISFAIWEASNGDTILVADGTYGYTHFDGKAITIQSMNGPENCIIDCTVESDVRFENGETRASILDGFKIVSASNGAIKATDSSATIRNCIIRGNDSLDNGGAIKATNAGLLIENCEFKNNEAPYYGGAIYLEDGGHTEINNCSFVENRGVSGDSMGGAIFAYWTTSTCPDMSLTVKDTTFSQNSCTGGGGAIFAGATDIDWPLPLQIEDCVFEGNHVSQFHGGAVFASLCDPLQITGTSIINNTATQQGGGVCVWACPNTAFVDSEISGNEAQSPLVGLGGGVYIIESGLTDAHVRMVNCVIAGNSANRQGGGINYTDGNGLWMLNCLVVDNSTMTGAGGAIFCDNVTDIGFWNSTLTGNLAGNGTGPFAAFETVNVSGAIHVDNSIIWDNQPEHMLHPSGTDVSVSYCDVQGGVAPAWDGGNNIDTDPLFEDVINFQRPWSQNDYHLSSTSPCIDAGNTLLVYSDTEDVDGDGDVTERIPLDLDGSFRIADSREVADTGVPDPPDYPAVVDMGCYEMAAYCIGEEILPPDDILNKVDYAETVLAAGWVDPPSAAFYHACIPSALGGDDCSRGAVFAAEEQTTFTIVWKYLENPGDWVYQEWPVIYRTGRCLPDPPVEYALGATRFFKSYPEATVTLKDYYHVVVRYNGTISENFSEEEGDEPGNPDISILPNGEVQVTEDCPDGRVVLEYSQNLGGPLVGLEVVEVTSEGAELYAGLLAGGAVPIGRLLEEPEPGAEYCRSVVIRNTEEDEVAVAWFRPSEETDEDIYPIRPEANSHKFIVGWYKTSPLQNCWPDAVYRYITDWPLDPQLHVIHENAEQGDIPAGSQVDLRDDLYCRVEVMYQQGFGDGDEPPYGHITANGAFAARNPGYSVLRFDKQPDEISDCGDWVTFEVVESYDRTDSMVLAPADVGVSWDIGTRLRCTGGNCGCDLEDCSAYFDEEAETYPFGFLFIPQGQESAPYAVGIYQETGQIFPVNSSAEHGVLEAWWCKEGAYAQGVYWPNKAVTYDCAWNCDPGRQIVIASRQGAAGYPTDVSGGYPMGSQIYALGAVGTDEFGVPGWNPNDEHAILLPVGGKLKVFAVRDDNNWGVSTGHPYVLVQYPDPDDETLWGMGAHCVVAEYPPDDFYYDTYTAIDEECGCGEDGKCFGGWTEGADCETGADCVCSIEVPVVAGQPIDPLFPVNYASAVCMDNQDPPQPKTWVQWITGDALWLDRKGGIWAVEDWDEPESTDCEVDPDDPSCVHSTADIYIWENWAADFGCQPWLANGPGGSGGDGVTPWPVRYDPNWPAVDPNPNENVLGDACTYPDEPLCAPLRHIGATFDQSGQCGSIEMLHDSVGVRIIDPAYEVSVPYATPLTDDFFAPLPPHLSSGEIGGGGEWPDRIWYDFLSNELVFRGVMSDRDKEILLDLDNDGDYQTAIENLYTLSRVQIGNYDLGENIGYCDGGNDGAACHDNGDCSGGTCVPFEATSSKFVSLADQTAIEGWVTMAVQNDQDCVDAGLPVSVYVWRVECPPDQGRIRVIVPECPLSEKQVLQFSGDGGGRPELLYFQWQYSDNYDSFAPELAVWNDYNLPTGYEDGLALREVMIEGASQFTLGDSYWRVRYRGYTSCPCTDSGGLPCTPVDGNGDGLPDGDCDCNHGSDGWHIEGESTSISEWTEVQLAEGWVKRVIRGINPFDQRVEDFHVNEAATYVDMIRQVGKRYMDPVPLNCDPENINKIGLIELYETVLGRARAFSIDQGGTPTDPITKAILLVAGKISELYMLLGNEAYADALDPTIGVFADQGEPSGTYDPHAVFCFEDQVESLLEEELALLRGRDFSRSPDYDADGAIIATVDNRLPWNFTSGNGQIAYANNYQMNDVEEAMATYPQGHGDAWGYYLTAIKEFYALLQHWNPDFEWINTTEDVLVGGQPVPVGYKYERKFAVAAAARARAGAGITSLTFRQRYTPDPLDQQLGYPDADTARAWGVADWARRAGQGAYLDWVVANAMLPAEDTTHEGIQKIDRTTVAELREIAAYYAEIQTILDKADAGLNPLGMAADVVPFGLDPKDLAEEGVTHFDQVLQRAVIALNNASTAFNYANSNTQRLRSMQDSLDDFEDLIEERELDYVNRLIEIYGQPYDEDVGVGGAYPDGYVGPDIFHFAYMDDSVLLQSNDVSTNSTTGTTTISVTFEKPDFTVLGARGTHFRDAGEGWRLVQGPPGEDVGDTLEALDEWVVDFNVSTDGLGLVKPASWGSRPVPGEIQFARAELLQAVARYRQALLAYEISIDDIEDQVDLLCDLYDLDDNVLGAMIAGRDRQSLKNDLILVARTAAAAARTVARIVDRVAQAAAEALPKNFVAGVASGGDFTSVPRSGIWTAGVIGSEIASALADVSDILAVSLQHDKELVTLNQQITITGLQNMYQEEQQVVALKQMIRGLAATRLELYSLEEAIKQSTSRYHAAVARGLRLLEQRTAFRNRTVDDITQYRYRDMAFRVFRNDSLQKYRAQFDLAARYAYLAAKAYDYETNLLGSDSLSGQHFLESIVRERSLGVTDNGAPLVGNGLAGKLAEMAANFGVLRSELGFNNKDHFQRTFSLRWELFRIPNSVAYDANWRTVLTSSVVPDLNELNVYQLHCQPLMPVRESEPAIVIPFSTSVASGLNLFGWDSSGDEILPSDRYAIKIHSFNVGFSQSYASPPLNKEVHAYLVPTGTDFMRVPTDGSIREWNVLDQCLPVPFPVSEAELQRPDWMPWDTLVGGSAEMVHRRRIPTVTARPITDETQDLSYKLTGRSIWNSQWYLIIPGSELMGEDPNQGVDLLINGESGTGVRDIKLTFECYGYSGDVQPDL